MATTIPATKNAAVYAMNETGSQSGNEPSAARHTKKDTAAHPYSASEKMVVM
jgi:hypothetical protein